MELFSYIAVSTDHDLNNTNKETSFTEMRRVFEGYFEIKVQEVSVLKYLNFRVCQSSLGLSVDQTYPIM